MSRYDAYTQKDYVEGLRGFLGIPRQGFLSKYNLVEVAKPGRSGAYNADAVQHLEALFNEKSAKGEQSDTSLGERLSLARDYQGLTDAQLGRECGVSREAARRWCAGDSVPEKPESRRQLLSILAVPEAWLFHGDVSALPADAIIGIRVGAEFFAAREALYGHTQHLLASLPADLGLSGYQAAIERHIQSSADLRMLARRAGGRWQLVDDTDGSLLFAPWEPIHEHGLSRRYWSDEVETLIADALATEKSIYAAWHVMAKKAKAQGLDYPQMITLRKRIDRDRERAERYGVDLNAMVQGSMMLHPH